MLSVSGEMMSFGRLLPVRDGEIGLRQSDAVFHHTRQLPEVFSSLGNAVKEAEAVGVSDRPRDAEDSYMPCFLVGLGAAQMVGQSLGIPVYRFSHQQGHIAAALFSAGRLELLGQRFLAFHLSGGTTEAVLVEPENSDRLFSTKRVAASLDVKAGQVIDRIGVMLGLSFPAGKAVDALAQSFDGTIHVRPSMKGADCSLSGVENKCRMLEKRGAPSQEIAATCIAHIVASAEAMCMELLREYGNMPVLFSGGVSSNSALRARMEKQYGAIFAEPRFSTDNAAGAAVLASLRKERE